MANSIELIKKYAAENLDKIFMLESVTGILENRAGVPLKPVENDASTVLIPDIVMDGLGDYDRTNGFPTGSVNLKWTPYQVTKDRAKSFQIDSIEDAESAGVTGGNLMSEFDRTQVVPEVDAYRLSTLAAKATVENTKTETISANTIISKFNDVIQVYTDNEISLNNLVIFVSSEIDKFIRNTTELQKKIEQSDYAVGNITFKIKKYEGIPIVVVPKTRFKTAYDFGDNGFAPATGASDINFLVVHTNAALPYKKHQKVRVFDPDTNQDADAWKFQYRLYHDIIIPVNKQKGIYVSKKAVA